MCDGAVINIMGLDDNFTQSSISTPSVVSFLSLVSIRNPEPEFFCAKESNN